MIDRLVTDVGDHVQMGKLGAFGLVVERGQDDPALAASEWPSADLLAVMLTCPRAAPNTRSRARASQLSLLGVEVPWTLTCPMLASGTPASSMAACMHWA